MLTRKQQEVLNFIKQYMNAHGDAPTTSEIAKGIGIVSRGVVYRYIKALKAAGKIDLLPNRHRNIQLIPEERSPTELPLLGKIAAGKPIEAIHDEVFIDLIDDFVGRNMYLLEVEGDSMLLDGIRDKDLVVCRHASVASPGDIIVALLQGQNVTLKHYHPEGDTVVLKPANDAHSPQRYPADQVTIQGVCCGLVRKSTIF